LLKVFKKDKKELTVGLKNLTIGLNFNRWIKKINR